MSEIENTDEITFRFTITVTVPTHEMEHRTPTERAGYVGRQVEKMIENNSDWYADAEPI